MYPITSGNTFNGAFNMGRIKQYFFQLIFAFPLLFYHDNPKILNSDSYRDMVKTMMCFGAQGIIFHPFRAISGFFFLR